MTAAGNKFSQSGFEANHRLHLNCSQQRATSRCGARSFFRVGAAVANSTMCFYIFIAYLATDEHERVSSMRMFDGSVYSGAGSVPQRLVDYLFAGEHDAAFEELKTFTFSLAMLDRLGLFFLVGTAVAIVYFVLERDRVRWLQAAVTERLPADQAKKANLYLEIYLWCLGSMFFLIMMLVPFHLDRPRAHYATAILALIVGFTMICVYLAVPIDFESFASSGDDICRLWAFRQHRCVRPVLKAQAFLHILTLGAAVLKAERMGDDRAALLFGIFETLIIVGYQVVLAVFMFDDVMVGTKFPAPSAPLETRAERKKVPGRAR